MQYFHYLKNSYHSGYARCSRDTRGEPTFAEVEDFGRFGRCLSRGPNRINKKSSYIWLRIHVSSLNLILSETLVVPAVLVGNQYFIKCTGHSKTFRPWNCFFLRQLKQNIIGTPAPTQQQGRYNFWMVDLRPFVKPWRF